MAGPLSGVLVADFSRVLAGPYATMLLADMGAEVVKVESPDGDETRTWTPPDRDGVSTYYLGINRGKRSVALDLRDEGDLVLARELARRADVMIQNFKPGGLAKYGLDAASARAANPGLVYASISGFGPREGAQGARLRPDGAGGVGPHEPHRRRRRAAVPGRHLGVRRDGGQPRGDRHPRRAAAPRRDRRGPGGGGQPAVVGALGPGQPQLGVGGGRRGALPHGQRAPSRLPVRAAAHGRPRPHRRRPQRPHLPQAVRRARHPGGARRPALPAQRRPHRQPGRAAADPRRAARHQGRGGVVRAARRRRGAVRADQHHRRRVRDGGEVRPGAGRAGGGGRARAAGGAAPDHVLRPRPPTTRCRRPSSTSTAPSCGSGSASTEASDRSYPTALGASDPRRRSRCSARTSPQDVMGEVGFGELAFWLATQRAARRPARCGCSRRCWPRWPTTGSPRPRSSPG